MIDKSAIIDKNAEIDKDVKIGAHVVIGPNVKIHSGTEIMHHAWVDGHTEIHKDVKIFPYAAVGAIPQDLKYKGGESYLEVGARSVIREFVTINTGAPPCPPTVVGSDCLMMAYSHLGHNVTLGNNVIIANAGTLAGHVVVEDNVIIGGLVGIHQFVKVGKFVIIGGCSKVVKDILPYMLADGNPLSVKCINKIGLERSGFSKEAIKAIKDAFKIIYKSKMNMANVKLKLKESAENHKEVLDILKFIEESERGITKGNK